MSYLNFWSTYIFTLFLKPTFGPGYRKNKSKCPGKPLVHGAASQALCGLCPSYTVSPKTWYIRRKLYSRQQWKWSKSESTCLSHTRCLSYTWRHPAEPFCFPLLLLTLWIKTHTSLALSTLPDTSSYKWKHSFTPFLWRLEYALWVLPPPYSNDCIPFWSCWFSFYSILPPFPPFSKDRRASNS